MWNGAECSHQVLRSAAVLHTARYTFCTILYTMQRCCNLEFSRALLRLSALRIPHCHPTHHTKHQNRRLVISVSCTVCGKKNAGHLHYGKSIPCVFFRSPMPLWCQCLHSMMLSNWLTDSSYIGTASFLRRHTIYHAPLARSPARLRLII